MEKAPQRQTSCIHLLKESMAQFHSVSLFTVLTDKDGFGRCWEKEAPHFAQWNRIDKPALQVFDVCRGWCAAQEEISLALNWH